MLNSEMNVPVIWDDYKALLEKHYPGTAIKPVGRVGAGNGRVGPSHPRPAP